MQKKESLKNKIIHQSLLPSNKSLSQIDADEKKTPNNASKIAFENKELKKQLQNLQNDLILHKEKATDTQRNMY